MRSVAPVYDPVARTRDGHLYELHRLVPALNGSFGDEWADREGWYVRFGRQEVDVASIALTCEALASWQGDGEGPAVAVPVCGTSLDDHSFVDGLLRDAASWSVPVSRLRLAVCPAVSWDAQGGHCLRELRQAGVQWKLMGFGHTHGSFALFAHRPYGVEVKARAVGNEYEGLLLKHAVSACREAGIDAILTDAMSENDLLAGRSAGAEYARGPAVRARCGLSSGGYTRGDRVAAG